MEQLHFHPKFQAEMVLVTFAETKVTPAEGNNNLHPKRCKKNLKPCILYVIMFPDTII